MEYNKILIISPICPLPEEANGTSLIVHNISKTLSATNYVTVLFPNTNNQNIDIPDELPYKLETLSFYQLPINYLKLIYTPRNSHWTIGKNLSVNLNQKFDLIIVFRLDMGFFIADIADQIEYEKFIFYPIDLLSGLYDSLKRTENSYIKRLYYLYQEKLLIYWERKFLRTADLNAFVSIEDARRAQIMCPELVNIRGFRNGVETYHGSYKVREQLNPCRIGFSGDFSYKPNRDAAHFIIDGISPALSENVIPIHIYLIGRNPDEFMKNIKPLENVYFHVTNEVDSIDAWLEKLDIYICPLFSGAGMKNKILKAMSIGLPIISTRHGVDGIEGHVDGESYIATNTDNTNSWANNIKYLMGNYQVRRSISLKCKELIGERYSWHSVVSDIAITLESLSMESSINDDYSA